MNINENFRWCLTKWRMGNGPQIFNETEQQTVWGTKSTGGMASIARVEETIVDKWTEIESI
jgi:hypothetical protein